MTQYLMHKRRDFHNLKCAVENYCPIFFSVSPFSMGNETTVLGEDLQGKTLSLSKNTHGLIFFTTDKELIRLPLRDYAAGFKLEYQNSNGSRMYPYYNDPNDPGMPMPAISSFRNVIDDLLIEISFKGKILLEPDKENSRRTPHWKLVL